MSRYKIKKPKNNVLILLIAVCVVLIFLIFYIQGKTVDLQRLLMRKTQSDETKTEQVKEPEPMPYTATLRIVITAGDGAVYRNQVTVYGDKGMTVSSENGEETLEANVDYPFLEDKVVRLSAPEGGQLFLRDDAKTNGYEGVLELQPTKSGVAVVNEINMEHYLKRVVPSEMPHTYGKEALKAQAVCARTYAYAHSNSYAYPELKGQMDDTVSFQVYNNGQETQETNQAVAETAGQILMCDKKVLDAMYYSTSCGYTQDGSLFGGSLSNAVFPCEYIGTDEKKVEFDTYIRNSDDNAYESNERYFRWKANVKETDITSAITAIQGLQKEKGAVVCNAKTKKILADSKKIQKRMTKLCNIEVLERNPGGAVTKIKLDFDGESILINEQLHIRQVLGSITGSLTLQDGELMTEVSTLPSAAFSVEKQGDGFLLYGGGFGHGVGMSQNGAKALAGMGYAYGDILNFFYKKTEIVTI